jgi:hypothetical protein
LKKSSSGGGGLEPHWKVRVAVPGALLHLASRTEPVPQWAASRLGGVEADWVTGPEYGDTIGFIDWKSVTAITWRWSP